MMRDTVKWRVLFGGFFSYTFDAMDILLLAMCLQAIMADLQLAPAAAGMLATSTMIGEAVSAVTMGWYSDNYGRRAALQVSLVSFSIFTMAIALSTSYWEILVLRFVAGLGLGGLWGVISAYISETWPIHQRGRAAAFALSSFPLGVALAAYFAGHIIPEYGWRAVFWTAGLAIPVAIYIHFFVPESAAWKAQHEARKEVWERDHKKPDSVTLDEIFTRDLAKSTILGALVAGLSLSAYWGTTTWLPTYLVRERGLSVSDMGMFMTVLSVGMFIGYQLFGWLADTIGKRRALLITLFGCAVTLPMYALATDRIVLLWLGPVYAFFIAWVGLFGSYFGELYPTRVRATGAGFCFNVGRGVSAFAPVLFGGLAQMIGIQLALGVCGALFLLAGIVMVFLPNTEILAQKHSAEDEAARLQAPGMAAGLVSRA
jgi:MFS family permease